MKSEAPKPQRKWWKAWIGDHE